MMRNNRIYAHRGHLLLLFMFAVAISLPGCSEERQAEPAAAKAAEIAEISVGQQYAEAIDVLAQADAEDWTAACSYMIAIPDNSDLAATATYHHLNDGFNFTLYGKCPMGTASREEMEDRTAIIQGHWKGCEQWKVSGISLSDSSELRAGKSETDFPVTRIVFRDGRSYPEGLPETTLYLHLDRDEVLRRMKPYKWTRTDYDPAKAPPRTAKENIPAACDDDRWELYESGGKLLYLKFRPYGGTETLEEILYDKGISFEIFDQFTNRRRQNIIIPPALPGRD